MVDIFLTEYWTILLGFPLGNYCALSGKSRTLYITPGSPWENPFIERFIGILKAECLDRYLFDRLSEAQTLLDHYTDEYNRFRPHSSLDYLTPLEFRQACDGLMTLTPTGT